MLCFGSGEREDAHYCKEVPPMPVCDQLKSFMSDPRLVKPAHGFCLVQNAFETACSNLLAFLSAYTLIVTHKLESAIGVAILSHK